MYTFIVALFSGLCIDLFKEIASALDFDYEMYESEDGYFGSLNEDGTWNGAIHELIEKVGFLFQLLRYHSTSPFIVARTRNLLFAKSDALPTMSQDEFTILCINCPDGSVARAFNLQAEGCGFKPRTGLTTFLNTTTYIRHNSHVTVTVNTVFLSNMANIAIMLIMVNAVFLSIMVNTTILSITINTVILSSMVIR